ncbi:MAG TPA: XRE family transcriptional regulator [Solirubrobacteraceae bacterium]|jgi:transcriptional regulator with XRE-family HTH domain|nr:XRE family transcriptional regulator [Solirubrobacteraceae bacterium]
MELAAIVGARLRAARRDRHLSLAALAAAAGIGKGSLSEIENGVRNPTLGTLYALADALGVPLATLLDGRVGARITSPGIEARLLDVTTEADASTVEVYRLSFEPGTNRIAGGHGQGVVEHLLVTSGRLRVGRHGEEHEIGPGESLQWTSDVEHSYLALGDDPVHSVLVIRSSGAAGRAASSVESVV